MTYRLSPHTNDLLQVAMHGEDADWKNVDENLRESDIHGNDIAWALYKASSDPNRDVRDFGATLLNVSTMPLNVNDMRSAEAWMLDEDDIVTRFRLAIALYARGSKLPQVRRHFDEALHHPDVKRVAEKFYDPRDPKHKLKGR